MLDLRFIRENIDLVREALVKRRDSAPLDEILELDTTRRQKVTELEDLRRARKETARKRTAADEGRRLRAKIRELEEEVRSLDTRLEELLLQVPNLPRPPCRWAPAKRITSWCAPGESRGASISSQPPTGNWGRP